MWGTPSHGLTGIENVIQRVFPEATIQLCTVHLTRNILAKVKPTDKQQVANEVKQVLNPENATDKPIDGIKRLHEFVDRWAKTYPSLKIYKKSRAHFLTNPKIEIHTFLNTTLYNIITLTH